MAETTSGTAEQKSCDYAIVGGGVSGLYTAWRLLKDAEQRGTGDCKVVVYEQSSRVGGRLLSWVPVEGLRAELGGMRFFEQQQLVWRLLEELHLGGKQNIIDFHVDGPGLLWNLRGVRMAAGDNSTAQERYVLDPRERDRSAIKLFVGAINSVLREEANVAVFNQRLRGRLPRTRADWDEVKPHLTYDGKRLWDVGFWNLLADKLSYEAYNYIVDSFGYYSLASNWNAAEALQNVMLEFIQNPAYKTLSHGYEALPQRLAEEVTTLGRKVNGDGWQTIRRQHRLRRFDKSENGVQLTLTADGRDHTVTAKNLVLAMPRRSLELLETSPTWNIQGNTELRGLVEAVQPYPAFKLFLLYRTRWWEQYGFGEQWIQHGRSVCDLPIRQTYYMRPDSCETPGGDCPSYGVLMASYDDARTVDYWSGLESPEDVREELDSQLGKDMAAAEELMGIIYPPLADQMAPARSGRNDHWWKNPPDYVHKANEKMIEEATEQLAVLHGVSPEAIPAPVMGAYANWTNDPFGGGWNLWRPQTDVQNVMQRIKKPLDSVNVFVTGEAYSGEQGWVEGALTTAESVLEHHLGMQRPEWLKGCYLGW